MKSKLLIAGFISLLLLQPLICSAQATESRDEEALRWFDESVNAQEPDLLFKALWYTESPRAYQLLELYTSGMSYSRRVVINWAIQASHAGILNAEQLNEIRRLIAEVRPPATSVDARAGQKHIAFVSVSDGRYVRYDFIGPAIPGNVERILEKVESEMSAESAQLDKFPKPDPAVISNPCAKRKGNDSDLEAMSTTDLLAYAGRRSLLPLDKYRAVKCYVQRVPDNTDDYTKYMRKWVERFEKGVN